MTKFMCETKDGKQHEISQEVFGYIGEVVEDLNADIAERDERIAALEEQLGGLQDVAEAAMKVRFCNQELTEALRNAGYLKEAQ